MENKKKKKDVRQPADSDSNPAGPEKVFRQDNVSVSIFKRNAVVRNQPSTFYSASFSRSYKDNEGEWQYSKSFDAEDLGKVMVLAKQAGEFINSERGLVVAAVDD